MAMMPPVKECGVTGCYFNRMKACHASAIQVGDTHPQCDTFTESPTHGGPAGEGHVGACKVTQCRFNNDLSCSAPGITVDYHGTHADCKTFEPR